MGCVIIWEGRAFVFEDKSSKDGVELFLQSWRPGVGSFSVHPIAGPGTKKELRDRAIAAIMTEPMEKR